MKILLATGIYPPDIGGPATYCRSLAEALVEKGVDVIVVAYGSTKLPAFARATAGRQAPSSKKVPSSNGDKWEVVRVAKSGGPLFRWWRYARALKKYGSDADVIYAFSSVSAGVPLWMARLRKPKKILRLGGDFLWERYTDHGGMKSLREWYDSRLFVYSFIRLFVERLLNTFDHIVFSTRFQEEIYEQHYKRLPAYSVIENAMPIPDSAFVIRDSERKRHSPFRLLFMGRFVGFKNLPALVEAVSMLGSVELTLVGDGPLKRQLATRYPLPGTRYVQPVHGEEKLKVFNDHDLLVLPSLTEISPNVALEAVASGLPVLLTGENGLSEELRQGMVVRRLKTPTEIAAAIRGCIEQYDQIVAASSKPGPARSWDTVVEEHLQLFERL